MYQGFGLGRLDSRGWDVRKSTIVCYLVVLLVLVFAFVFAFAFAWMVIAVFENCVYPMYSRSYWMMIQMYDYSWDRSFSTV